MLYPAVQHIFDDIGNIAYYNSFVVDEHDRIVSGPIGRTKPYEVAMKKAKAEAELIYWARTRDESSKRVKIISP